MSNPRQSVTQQNGKYLLSTRNAHFTSEKSIVYRDNHWIDERSTIYDYRSSEIREKFQESLPDLPRNDSGFSFLNKRPNGKSTNS